MKTEKEIREHKDKCYKEMNRIYAETPMGSGQWRKMKRYIDALEWVLGEE
jgi:hypothetical protein